MTKKEFFETEWARISGISDSGLNIELENEDGSQHVWVSVKNLLSVAKVKFEFGWAKLGDDDTVEINSIFNCDDDTVKEE